MQSAPMRPMQPASMRATPPRPIHASSQAEHPLNLLTIYGRQVKLHKNTQLHQDTERGEGLIPWNGDTETMIDRCGQGWAGQAGRGREAH